MSWVPPRLIRRLIVDPVWIPVAACIGLLLAAIVVVCAVFAPFMRRRRLLRAAALGCVYLYLDVALMLGALMLWLRYPHHVREDHAWRARHSRLLGWALTRLMSAAGTLVGYRVELVGCDRDVDTGRALVVLARHAGPGDSFTLVHLLLTSYERIPRVVVKRSLQWDPGLDVVLSRLKCYFLPSRSGAGEDRTTAVSEMVDQLGPGDALLLFPEGGNWTPRRHRRAVIRLRRAGRRQQARVASSRTHVLPPRSGGTVAALAVRADTDVLVVAHCGLDTLVNPQQIWAALPLRERPMRITARLHPAGAVPRDEQAIATWLDQQWAAVDRWINTQSRHDQDA